MRYASKVEAELAAIVGRPVRVRFTVMNSDREEQSGAEQRKNDVSVEPRRGTGSEPAQARRSSPAAGEPA